MDPCARRDRAAQPGRRPGALPEEAAERQAYPRRRAAHLQRRRRLGDQRGNGSRGPGPAPRPAGGWAAGLRPGHADGRPTAAPVRPSRHHLGRAARERQPHRRRGAERRRPRRRGDRHRARPRGVERVRRAHVEDRLRRLDHVGPRPGPGRAAAVPARPHDRAAVDGLRQRPRAGRRGGRRAPRHPGTPDGQGEGRGAGLRREGVPAGPAQRAGRRRADPAVHRAPDRRRHLGAGSVRARVRVDAGGRWRRAADPDLRPFGQPVPLRRAVRRAAAS